MSQDSAIADVKMLSFSTSEFLKIYKYFRNCINIDKTVHDMKKEKLGITKQTNEII